MKSKASFYVSLKISTSVKEAAWKTSGFAELFPPVLRIHSGSSTIDVMRRTFWGPRARESEVMEFFGACKSLNHWIVGGDHLAHTNPLVQDTGTCKFFPGGHSSMLCPHFLCAEHVRQLGGESPLDNLMEVKS
jgi:hypothetical protein